MTQTPDITAMFKDMMGKFPVDMSAFEDAFKTQAAFGEKMSAVALEAAMKSAEISSTWTKASLEKVADLSKANTDPAAAAQTLSEFASSSAEMAAENMAAIASVAKKVQLDSAELMMAAGKDVSAEAEHKELGSTFLPNLVEPTEEGRSICCALSFCTAFA